MALTYQSRNPHTAVTITVGSHDCKETFIVYKEFLCYYSPFFDAAFNSSFIEGQTQTMEYPDAHPHVFGIFVQWIHTQTIGSVCYKAESAFRIVQLWILSDRLLVPSLQNLAIRVLCGYNYWLPDLETFQMAYTNTGFGSPIQRLLIKAFAIRSKLSQD
jgi:BTB/POZ domain